MKYAFKSTDNDFKDFEYNSDDVMNIVMHIYPPCGAHLKNTRKSTWLNPIVDNDNATTSSQFFKKGNRQKILSK